MAKESYEVMQARLTKLFDAVANKTHWKNPVDATMDAAMFEAMGGEAAFTEAVVHFTATVPRFVRYPGLVRVMAAGYYSVPSLQ